MEMFSPVMPVSRNRRFICRSFRTPRTSTRATTFNNSNNIATTAKLETTETISTSISTSTTTAATAQQQQHHQQYNQSTVMLSTHNQVSTFEFDPLWVDNGQDHPSDDLGSSPTQQSAYFNMCTDWMTTSPSSWSESMFGDKSFVSLNIEAYSPLDNEGPWSPMEGDFSLGYQPMISSDGTMIPGGYSDYKNQTKTEVNGFNLSWPPTKQSTASQSTPIQSSEWTGNHPIQHPHTPETIDQSVVPAMEHCSTDEESVQETPTFGSPKAPAASVTKTKCAKKETGPRKEPKRTTKRTKPNSSPNHKSRSSSSSSSSTSSYMRTNHNMIEKQYRNRLNVQFESLLEILPKRGEDEKRVGKAEVLTNANRYIQQLEKNIKKLEEKNVGLEGSVRDLTKRWVATGEEEMSRNSHGIC